MRLKSSTGGGKISSIGDSFRKFRVFSLADGAYALVMIKTNLTPETLVQHRDYGRVAKALDYIYQRQGTPPSLAETANHVGLSEFHFQRLFRRWAGISPKQFCQFLSLHQSRERLLDSKSLLETSIESGMSGAGRLHDCFVSLVAMTPAEYRDGGRGLTIQYGTGQTPFGTALIAFTTRGVCMLEFLNQAGDTDTENAPQEEMRERARAILENAWPAATYVENSDKAARQLGAIFGHGQVSADKGIVLHTRGTNFQIRVWEALLQLPAGYSVNYDTLAAHLNIESGARAVASAVSRNPVAYLVPCHRVIRKSGEIGQYRWGSVRKHAMLGWEAAQSEQNQAV